MELLGVVLAIFDYLFMNEIGKNRTEENFDWYYLGLQHNKVSLSRMVGI
jgi:hypothetical protein